MRVLPTLPVVLCAGRFVKVCACFSGYICFSALYSNLPARVFQCICGYAAHANIHRFKLFEVMPMRALVSLHIFKFFAAVRLYKSAVCLLASLQLRFDMTAFYSMERALSSNVWSILFSNKFDWSMYGEDWWMIWPRFSCAFSLREHHRQYLCGNVVLFSSCAFQSNWKFKKAITEFCRKYWYVLYRYLTKSSACLCNNF